MGLPKPRMTGGGADKQEGAESEPDVNSGSVEVGGDDDKQSSSKKEKNEECKEKSGTHSILRSLCPSTGSFPPPRQQPLQEARILEDSTS